MNGVTGCFLDILASAYGPGPLIILKNILKLNMLQDHI